MGSKPIGTICFCTVYQLVIFLVPRILVLMFFCHLRTDDIRAIRSYIHSALEG